MSEGGREGVREGGREREKKRDCLKDCTCTHAHLCWVNEVRVGSKHTGRMKDHKLL